MSQENRFEIRRATVADIDQIADAHLDSIRSIGPNYYSVEIVSDWGSMVACDIYMNAMAGGELFFVAQDESGHILGFSSHRIDEGIHGVSVYVRGRVARLGMGSGLLQAAVASAIRRGADSIHIDASLAAVDFYKVNGFKEIARGEHLLGSGRVMPCVFMSKKFTTKDTKDTNKEIKT